MTSQQKLIQDIEESISDFQPTEVQELDIIIKGLEDIISQLRVTREQWNNENN